jgi:hypothetical protein
MGKHFGHFKNAEGVEYDIEYKGPTSKYEGDAANPDFPNPTVRISTSLLKKRRQRRQLSIVLEEMLHAHDFSLTEKVVRKYSANTAKLLYEMGWRWEGSEKAPFKE